MRENCAGRRRREALSGTRKVKVCRVNGYFKSSDFADGAQPRRLLETTCGVQTEEPEERKHGASASLVAALTTDPEETPDRPSSSRYAPQELVSHVQSPELGSKTRGACQRSLRPLVKVRMQSPFTHWL